MPLPVGGGPRFFLGTVLVFGIANHGTTETSRGEGCELPTRLFSNLKEPPRLHFALKVVDTLDTGRGHPCPGGVERAGEIDSPASGLDKHGVEAKPAGVHRGIVHAKIGG
jgi:hypothetical protein